jgi:hypothetical protein
MPFVVPLIHERSALGFVKLGHPLESIGITCDDSSAAEQSSVLA